MHASKPLLLRSIAVVLSLLFIVALLFFSLQWTIDRPGFFFDKYEKLDHAKYMGMHTQELAAATVRMIDYMAGRADSIDIEVTVSGEKVSMFNDRERAHMVDVRALYQSFRTFSYIALALFAALLAFFGGTIVYEKGGKQSSLRVSGARAFLRASCIFSLLVVALGAWVLIDFNSFWTSFHLLFFTNDLWILDPATSRMINMMPLQLFYDIVLRFAALFLGIWAGCMAICLLLLRRGKMRQAKA